MKGTTQELLNSIQARRGILMRDYSEYELHQLRVSVRRLRGLLRFEDAPEAWHLRQDWSYLISHTNACRDWDTLANRIEALPPEEQPVTLVDAVDEKREQIWRDVSKSLKLLAWDEAVERTHRYVDHRVDAQDRPPSDDDSVRDASRRLERAWKRVQEQDKNRAWHKLRIAVKDLRYSLDATGEEKYAESIKLCKLLQEQLGNWHDTIVHRELLHTLDRELGKSEIAAKHALQALESDMKREAKRCLEDVSSIMSGSSHTLTYQELMQL